MKKITTALLLTLMMAALLLTGCSSSETKEVSVKKLGESLVNEIGFEDTLTEIDKDNVLYLYQFEEKAVKSFAVYESSGATAEEVAVFEAASAEDAKVIKEAVQTRIDTQKQNYENYVPKELVKLEKPVIKSSGTYIVLCVSNDNDKAKEIIDEAFK